MRTKNILLNHQNYFLKDVWFPWQHRVVWMQSGGSWRVWWYWQRLVQDKSKGANRLVDEKRCQWWFCWHREEKKEGWRESTWDRRQPQTLEEYCSANLNFNVVYSWSGNKRNGGRSRWERGRKKDSKTSFVCLERDRNRCKNLNYHYSKLLPFQSCCCPISSPMTPFPTSTLGRAIKLFVSKSQILIRSHLATTFIWVIEECQQRARKVASLCMGGDHLPTKQWMASWCTTARTQWWRQRALINIVSRIQGGGRNVSGDWEKDWKVVMWLIKG